MTKTATTPKAEQFNKAFNAFILIGMTVSMIFITALKLQSAQTDKAMLLVAAFGSLCGVLSTVCSANAKILTFLFGFFDVAIYGVMCFLGGKYGNAALHMLYFLPMQFVGFFQWRKRGGASSGTKLKARRLVAKSRWIGAGAFLAGSAVCYYILFRVSGTANPVSGGAVASVLKLGILSDAMSTVCNIMGQLLMSTAYMEQWVFWIGVNVSSVVMWALTLSSSPHDSYALIYLVKYSFYLLNSLNGLRIWLALSRS